ncbi:MAG: UDP-2,3-diacylglucosamine diphosphatase [Betaproteobacteria bacterium]|nr:UDP-2,3-diacylglucosamine diphosphatase [Betaproteobacteria bacterium]
MTPRQRHPPVTRWRCNGAMQTSGLTSSAPHAALLAQALAPPSEHDAVDDAHAPHQFRTLWLSDIHLGTRDCKAKALLELLRHCHAGTIYLVGDIIDGWQLRKGWYWPQAHNDVVQKLLRKTRKGCRVVFIPGNHDEFARHYSGLHFGGVEVQSDAVHVTADGTRLWIVHGDWFDGVVMHAKWLAHLGDALYVFTLKLNRWLNHVRHRMGFSYWSLSQYLKGKVKNAVSFISSFEQLLAEEAARRGCEGVVCGHIHRAELRRIGRTIYANCGDWVESLTAVAEQDDGSLLLLMWKSATASPQVLAELRPASTVSATQIAAMEGTASCAS